MKIRQYDSLFLYSEDGLKKIRNPRLSTIFISKNNILEDGSIKKAIVGDAVIQEKGYNLIVETRSAEQYTKMKVIFTDNFIELEVKEGQEVEEMTEEELQQQQQFLLMALSYN